MGYRDLTIRVFGNISNCRYTALACEISARLAEVGLDRRAVLVTDDKITGAEMEIASRGSHICRVRG